MKKNIIIFFVLIFCSQHYAIGQTMEELIEKTKKISYEGQLNRAEELLGNEKQDLSKSDPSKSGSDDGMTYMFTLMVFGSIGTGYFIYGKKTSKFVFLLAGIGLCVFPIFITSSTINLVLGFICIVLPFKIEG